MVGKINSLLEFFWKSDTIYRFHPPGLYKLNEKVFENKDHYYDSDLILEQYQILLRQEGIVEDSLFASKRAQSGIPLSAFAAKALHSPAFLNTLYKLVRLYQPSKILELGSCMGISTLCLGLAARESEIISVEGNTQFSKIAEQVLKNHVLTNVKILNETFDSALNELKNKEFDFVFLDGDHSYEASISIVNKLIPLLSKNAILVMDDIHWSTGMYKAWKELIIRNEFQCSLETLRWGLLFMDRSLTSGKYCLIPRAYKFWQKYY
ncbi:MAG: class I SAM-dependent methyltransferase [Saprospiraceae bacterium]